MAQLGEAVARYHELLETRSFRDLAWAEELQAQMRRRGLTDSGRLVSPVLRPHFISRSQLAKLKVVAERLTATFDRLEAITLSSPELLARMRMLPAEKVLASAPCGYTRSSIACRMDAGFQNGSLSVRSVETCKPSGLAYADMLGDLFLKTPVMREFRRKGYDVCLPNGPATLFAAIQKAWKEYGGNHQPNIAVVEFGKAPADQSSEGELIAQTLAKAGASVQLAAPEQLEYRNKRLTAGNFAVDIVYRRVLTREILVRHDLAHPLLEAYRDRAVCVVNGFRSEAGRRRALFELLTDEAIGGKLSAVERNAVREYVPWTRVVSSRKTCYKDQQIDLVPFVLKNRERFVLRPNDDCDGQQTFVGAQIGQSTWEHALRSAAQTSYVVQEHFPTPVETFPVLQYGEVNLKQTTVSVHPHILDGAVQGASANIESAAPGSSRPLALAPVMVLNHE
ncbi:MAG: hypothetical protein JO061_17505 [Acidobacteriaceae bacterium]|nr:hypothetical protein [Acidobacteriaceae bacterium]